MTFKKGTSGNPKGRKPASLTAAKLRDLITADDVLGILQSVITQAKAGDIQAAKLILDRARQRDYTRHHDRQNTA
jgi:hypothetical protein